MGSNAGADVINFVMPRLVLPQPADSPLTTSPHFLQVNSAPLFTRLNRLAVILH